MRRQLALGLLALTFAVASVSPTRTATAADGQAAAGFSLLSLDNVNTSLSDFENQVVLLNFWATWCGPCQVEMPHLQRIYDAYKDQGFVLLSISSDDARSSSRVKPLVKSKGFTFPVLLDKQTKVTNMYNPSKTLPYSELLDHEHKSIWKHQGYTPGDEDEIEEHVKAAVEARKAALGG
ncbi:MAG: TlpA family protein disulfide reductase [Alphaproteobacteria bacterium]|nr:TlpA family protein disulfide reductase [Alphaproteobacteria bacterium]